MAVDAGIAGLKGIWQSIRATAEFNVGDGLLKAWSHNVKAWGPPCEIHEVTVDHEGQQLKGRTFLKIGMVVWHPSDGAKVVGWATLPL